MYPLAHTDITIPPRTTMQAHWDQLVPFHHSPKHLYDPGDLVELARSGEEGQAEEEFDADAAQRPHVDRGRVGEAEEDLRGAVEAGLDVGVDRLSFVARRAKVNDLDVG